MCYLKKVAIVEQSIPSETKGERSQFFYFLQEMRKGREFREQTKTEEMNIKTELTAAANQVNYFDEIR